MGLWLILVFLIHVTAVGAQTTAEGKAKESSAHGSDLPRHPVPFKPRLSLVEGLKLADSYIQNEHIDISSYWLSEARFIVYGGQGKNSKSFPAWYFRWGREALGDYVEIIVSMDGKAMRIPSM